MALSAEDKLETIFSSVDIDDTSVFSMGLPHDPDAGLSDDERAANDKKLLRTLDMHLLPWLCFLYLICFLDRTNIGNAKIARLTKDIPMTTTQYSLTLTVFFISYAAFEALANFLLKRFKPSIFIPISTIFWGICMLSMGFVTDYKSFMVARCFLGVSEAGLFPGVNYLLSSWYRRNELAVRAALFFSAAAAAGSFGGLLAAAFQTLDGRGGMPGWAWIFIIEGLATVVVAVMSFWMVHDFPDQATFLTDDDKARVAHRLREDGQSSADREDFKIKYLYQALTDWKTYIGMLVYMGPLMPLYSFSLFLPTIIVNMGFPTDSIVQNQLLSVPPYAIATIATVLVGYYSDKYQRRAIFNLCLAPVGIAGFVMLIASDRVAVQYVGTFLGALGIYPTIPIIIAWIANNVEGVYKRGIVLGFVIGFGNLNGIVSSNVYYHAPRFIEGHATVIAYMTICIWGGSLLMWACLGRENALRKAGKRDASVQGKTRRELEEMGDMRPEFIYIT